jgi:UDP-2,3-diacylglucosamine hydrolase
MINNKIYFASDFHLGMPDRQSSLIREQRIVRWLDEVKKEASEIFLMGDIFDFWFEYRSVVPRGYVRFLGKIAEITDSGIPVTFFTGNHDMWMFDYLVKELNVRVVKNHVIKEYNGKKFFIGHGDGIGPGDHGYKFIKAVFANSFCQWLFARLHPNFAFGIAQFWSNQSREEVEELEFKGEDKEYQILFARELLKTEHIDYFILGHRHIPLDIQLKDNCRYMNIGDWIVNNTYAVFNGETLQLKKFNG